MEELTLTDFFAIFRRWKKIFFITVLIMLFFTFVFAEFWSNYRSTAVIQIEQSEISANATSPIGSGGAQEITEALADQRISVIEQKVTSTSSLIEIITKFDLYSSTRRHVPISLVAENMRKKIKIELISSTLANPAAAGHVSANDLSAIAFKLSFEYGSPLLAQQVTDELATRFLDEDLKERRTETEETAEFLGKQITMLETSLSDQENKIAEYQKEHGISNANSQIFNQQASASLLLNLQNLDSQITSNEGTLGALRAQLANVDPYSRVIADGQVITSPSVQLKALQAQYATLSAQYGPNHPDVVKIRHQIEALQTQTGARSEGASQLKAQIENTRTNLTAARETYGPEHPDVVALQNQMDKLETQMAMSRSSIRSGNGVIGDADNPAYLQASAELRAAEEQHKALLAQRDELVEQQKTYQKAISNDPQAEQEMASLSRDYENAQMRYRELKEKKMTADMEAQMQSERKGQRLTLIDPPEYPLGTHPPRMLLLLGGMIISVLCGLAAVALAQTLSGCVIGMHHMETITGFTPLVSIPHILTSNERKYSLRRKAVLLLAELTQNRNNRPHDMMMGETSGEMHE